MQSYKNLIIQIFVQCFKFEIKILLPNEQNMNFQLKISRRSVL